MLLGVVLSLGANALWAIAFLAPYVSKSISGPDFAFIRFSSYGLISLVIIVISRTLGISLKSEDIWQALKLGVVGYSISFTFTYASVNLIGGDITALIIGLMPVVFSLAANFHKKDESQFLTYLSAGMILIGFTVLKLDTLPSLLLMETGWKTWIGIFCSLIAMVSWGYFVTNNRSNLSVRGGFLEEGKLWIAWIGMGSFLGSVIVVLPFIMVGQSQLPKLPHVLAQHWQPIALAMFMGLCSSWTATWLWRVGSQPLSPALTAQLASSETVFALVYVMIYNRSLPSPGLMAGSVIIIGGIMLTAAASSPRSSWRRNDVSAKIPRGSSIDDAAPATDVQSTSDGRHA